GLRESRNEAIRSNVRPGGQPGRLPRTLPALQPSRAHDPTHSHPPVRGRYPTTSLDVDEYDLANNFEHPVSSCIGLVIREEGSAFTTLWAGDVAPPYRA